MLAGLSAEQPIRAAREPMGKGGPAL